ncbi:MAG: hypothetical protein RIB32_01240 [Phycisphaerales bacterium]
MRTTSRALSWSLAAVLLIAATASFLLVNVLAHERPLRLDLTSGGSHRVSPRTEALVETFTDRYEIVLAIDPSQWDRRALDAARDVLDAFNRASERIGFTELDLSGSAGADQADDLVQQLAAAQPTALDERASLLAAAVSELDTSASGFESLAEGLAGIRDAIPPDSPGASNNRAYFDQRAAVARVGARELAELAESIAPELSSGTLPGGLTDLNALLEPANAAVDGLLGQLVSLASDVEQFAQAEAMPAPARDAARPWGRALSEWRDRVSILADRLGRAEPLPLIDAARALQTGQTLLVVGPPDQGVRAIDLVELLPHPDALDRAGVTAGVVLAQRAEQLVFTALGTLARPDRPVVVLVHAETQRGVLESDALFGALTRRLATRGIDLAEWAVVADASPPDFAPFMTQGPRPIVYVALAPDSSSGSAGDSSTAGAARAEALGRTLNTLIARGEPVLAAANPSIFATYGDPDPVTQPLARMGVTARSGYPLLAETPGPGGPVVITDTRVVPSGSDHPIAEAASGLPALLPWAIGLDAEPTEGVTTTELLALNAGDSVWGESSWLGYWQTPRAQRGVVGAVPARDDSEDLTRERWTLALAIERTVNGRPARTVAVGSNGWMLDPIAARRGQAVDGRAPLAFPGNAEFFEASVLWLAGQDELIAPSGEARPVALIKPLSERQLSVIRWVLLAGLPGLILIAGIVTRVVRG